MEDKTYTVPGVIYRNTEEYLRDDEGRYITDVNGWLVSEKIKGTLAFSSNRFCFHSDESSEHCREYEDPS